jgi:hypothetical protein
MTLTLTLKENVQVVHRTNQVGTLSPTPHSKLLRTNQPSDNITQLLQTTLHPEKL